MKQIIIDYYHKVNNFECRHSERIRVRTIKIMY